MTTSPPSDEASPTKRGGIFLGDGRAHQATTAPRTLAALRDPRVVRVSRSLGGKDRHSKVSTIRGLRDRRVRLSVPTALQLYDLQDRLGLNQPSKAVDWLLNAAQNEIDKLPPLQIPPGGFIQHLPSIAAPRGADPYRPPSGHPAMADEMELMKEKYGYESLTLASRDYVGDQTGVSKPAPWIAEVPLKPRWKEPTRGAMDAGKDGLFTRLIFEQGHHGAEVQNLVPSMGSNNNSYASSMPSNNNTYASYYYNLDGSNICVTHLGGYVMPQAEETHGYRPQQLQLCPPRSAPPMFNISPHAAASSGDYDLKHVNSFQMGSPTSKGAPGYEMQGS